MNQQEWQEAMEAAVPHGPDEPCTCTGCWACSGREIGCTCDIEWDKAHELREYERLGGITQ